MHIAKHMMIAAVAALPAFAALGEDAPADAPATVDPDSIDPRLTALFVERADCGAFSVSPDGFAIAVSDSDAVKPLSDNKAADMQGVYQALAQMKPELDALLASEAMTDAKQHMSALDALFRQYEKAAKSPKEQTAESYMRLTMRVLREKPTAAAKSLLEARLAALRKQARFGDRYFISEEKAHQPEWLNLGEIGYVMPEPPEVTRPGREDKKECKTIAAALDKKVVSLWVSVAAMCRAAEGLKASTTAITAKKHLAALEKSIKDYEMQRVTNCGKYAYTPLEKTKAKASVAEGYAAVLESIANEAAEPAVKQLLQPKLAAQGKLAQSRRALADRAEAEAKAAVQMW